MGCWHHFVGSLIKPEDDFKQRLRKHMVGAFFLPGSIFALVYVILTIQAAVSVWQYVGAAANSVTFFTLVGSYFWMRHKQHVTDWHVTIVFWIAAFMYTVAQLASPESENKSIILCIATGALMTQILKPGLLLVLTALQILLQVYNDAMIRNPENMVCFPGTAGLSTIVTRLVAGFNGGLGFGVCLYLFYLQINEAERRGSAQRAANEMTVEILKSQKKYDTESVASILGEAKTAGVVDPELLGLFESMNVNLESYRPFLPNFLFLGPSANVVDDDAMSAMLSRGSLGVEEIDGESPASSDEAHGGGGGGGGHTPTSSEEKMWEATRDKPLRLNRSRSPIPEVQNVLQADSLQLAPPCAAPPVVNGYRGVICQACVELCSCEWFSTRLTRPPFSQKTSQHQRNTLSIFTDTLFDLAQSAKASVHSLVGDAVQLTWNATHRVTQPELKAALFLLRLKQAIATALPDIKLAGACCAGHAEVHNTISSSTRQQAMYVDAPWLPALDACYTLAKRYKTLIVDANIESVSHQQVVLQGVDCVRYMPKVPVVPESGEPGLFLHPGVLADGAFDPEGFPPSAPDHFDTLIGVTGAQQEESAKTFLERKPVCYTLAFELVKRKADDVHAEDEWLYGAGGDSGGGKTEDIEPMITGALMMCVDGQLGQAAALMKHAGLLLAPATDSKETQGDPPVNSSSPNPGAAYAADRPASARPKSSLLAKRLMEYCSNSSGWH